MEKAQDEHSIAEPSQQWRESRYKDATASVAVCEMTIVITITAMACVWIVDVLENSPWRYMD